MDSYEYCILGYFWPVLFSPFYSFTPSWIGPNEAVLNERLFEIWIRPVLNSPNKGENKMKANISLYTVVHEIKQ